MLKSCKYCGKMHEHNVTCPYKPKKKDKIVTPDDNITLFRWSKQWRHKRDEIKELDNFCCVVCRHNLYDTRTQYTTEGLSVHHIEPLRIAYDKRLDNNNLITLCSMHHAQAEEGYISKRMLKQMIRGRGSE